MDKKSLIEKSSIPRSTVINLEKKGLINFDGDGELDLLKTLENLLVAQNYKHAKKILDASDDTNIPNEIIEKVNKKATENKIDITELNHDVYKFDTKNQSPMVAVQVDSDINTIGAYIDTIRQKAEDSDLVTSMARKAYISSEHQLVKLAKDMGELIDLKTITSVNSNVLRILTNKFLGMGVSIIDELRKENDKAMQIQIIDNYVYETLSSLKNLKGGSDA